MLFEFIQTNCASFQIYLNLIFWNSDSPGAIEHGLPEGKKQVMSVKMKIDAVQSL